MHTAVLTSAVPLEDTNGLFPLKEEDEESADDNGLGYVYVEEDVDEPLSPEEERAWQLASHPRVWPILIWLVALLLVLGGTGAAMRSLGHELLPPAPASHSQSETGNQPEALFQ